MYLDTATRAASIWGREITAALEANASFCLVRIQGMSHKKKSDLQIGVHILKSGAHKTHSHAERGALTQPNNAIGHNRTRARAHRK